MNLNNRVPGLPEWPLIELSRDGRECLVQGDHISYHRYLLARRIVSFIAWGCILLGSLACAQVTSFWPMMIFVGFVAYIFIITIFPIARWICWIFLRQTTCVRFSRHEIVINRHRYDAMATTVQFRVNGILFSENGMNKEHYTQREYLQRFRIVEMIYGMRIVPIATIDYEFRAEQFVAALQYAYGLTRQQQVASPQSAAKKGRSLPE